MTCTFTAGGLSAPIFVTVYGCTKKELPKNRRVIIEVPGLTNGSHQDIYSQGVGYLSFVRSNKEEEEEEQLVENNEEMDNSSSNQEEEDVTHIENVAEVNSSKSVESLQAELYRKLVLHPLVKKIRKSVYGYDSENDSIPVELTAVSWSDGCGTQLNPITSESNMKLDKELRIVTNKHSAARTAVEQAADTGSMFKSLKALLRKMDVPTISQNSIYHYLSNTIDSMSSFKASALDDNVINMPSFKKKAIVATVANMPIACSCVYDHNSIKKAFVLNGQLDLNKFQVPSFANLIYTYRGDCKTTCLEKKDELFAALYKDAYLKGMISEQRFDQLSVPKDTDTNGNIVERDMPITQENRQRAKSLSSQYQIDERRNAIYSKQMIIYHKEEKLYRSEEETFNDNTECEQRIVSFFKKEINSEDDISFQQVSVLLTYPMIQKFGNDILKKYITSFIKVRSQTSLLGYKIVYRNVPKLKSELIENLWEMRTDAVNERIAKLPVLPIRVNTDNR